MKKNDDFLLEDKKKLNAVKWDNERSTQGQKCDLKLEFYFINQSFEQNNDT